MSAALNVRDFRREDAPEAACETCAANASELARARALLKTIARMEPKAARRGSLEDDAETCAAVGFAVYRATIVARIELFLKGRRA